jgi:hypothetical protein
MNAEFARPAARLDVTVNRRHRASSPFIFVGRLGPSGAASHWIQSTIKYFCQCKIIFPCSNSHDGAFCPA